MAISIRGGAPAVFSASGTPIVSGTLTGTQQPQAGDVLILIHCNDFYTLSTLSTVGVGGSASGVTLITNAVADGGSNLGHIKTYYYVVTSTGDTTVSAAVTGTGDEEKDLIVYVLAGADTSTVIDTAGNASYGTTTTHALPNISPTTSDAFLIAHDNSGGGVNVASYTPPSGMTETYDASNAGGMGATGAVLQLSASGPIGTLSFTPVASANGVVVAIAVLTATATPPPDPAGNMWARTPGRIAPSGIWTPGPYDYTPVAQNVSSTAEATTHDVVTGDPVASVGGADQANPDIGHQTFDATTSTAVIVNVNAELTNHTLVTGDPSLGVSVPADVANHAQVTQDATAGVGGSAGQGATSHTTGDVSATLTGSDTTAPANSHTTATPAPAVGVSAADSAITHQTFDPTVSTAVILNANAESTNHAVVAGDPASKMDVAAGAPALAHNTFDATGSISATAAAGAGDNAHTAQPATAGIGGGAQTALHSFVAADVGSTQTTGADAPQNAHSTFDATVSTHLQPPAFVSVDGGLSWVTMDNSFASTGSTVDGSSAFSSLSD